MTMTATNLDIVRRFLAGTHSANVEDVAVIDETVAASIVCHGFPGFPNGEFAGREDYKTFFRVFRSSFSDMDFETLATIARGDFVSAHWKIWATFSGPFADVVPDGRRVVFDGVALYRLQDGLIAETWLGFNMPLLLAQLGPQPRQAA
jgi:predicted ester cyclase